ncbi:2-oxoglutarate dehydrogenase E1 component [Nymphon striatum]|nr:2-oxoglutarate dehydrogenase E1 component [Nymphon striatum]
MHISNPEEAGWLKERIEGYGKEIAFTKEGRKAILNSLVQAEGFEKYLHVKYMGTKRFGLDGGESLIPAMEQIIKRGGQLGLQDIVIGMPHRRSALSPKTWTASGDVKYHLGASSDREFDGNSVHLSLTANPSHLEAVNPVVLGKVRAKQDQTNDVDRTKSMAILLHGDAAFAGQGVVAEGFALSGSSWPPHRRHHAYRCEQPDRVHHRAALQPLIALPNGQCAGGRSADFPREWRRSQKAVVHAARVATEFRQKFHKDVVLDIICYRRFGHNEGDEPMFTNPVMYKKIKQQKTTLTLYTDRLVQDGLMPEGEIEDMKQAQKDLYQRGQTAIKKETFDQIGKALTSAPEGFPLHKTVGRILTAKAKMFETGEGFDWATGEALAFGSLLTEGYPVRLSGQDSTRGTFSQRHSGLVNQDTEERYYPLNHIRDGQGNYEVIDSMLSEYAVLGFEYGYSLAEPNALTLWEAQFGDFANGAQIMFDQFISSGESKWLRMSGLVCLLAARL